MSTAELFLQPDEILDFIDETLNDEALTVIGFDDRGIGLCPFISFYVFHDEDQFLDVAHRMIEIYEAFEKIIDEPFQLVRRVKTQTWLKAGHKNLPKDLREDAQRCKDAYQVMIFGATDKASTAESARWAISATVDESGIQKYSRLKLTFRRKWYTKNKERWHQFVEECLRRLQPEQCYSGFEVGNGGFNIMGAYECDVLERISADYFYGMDIDHPMRMSHHSYGWPDYSWADGNYNPTSLGGGLRTPTWSFLLTPVWRKKLGKTEVQVRELLNDPRIHITTLPYDVSAHNPDGEPALWIRLGELDLHPVKKGLPELLVKANALIKPIRCDELALLTLDPWDDDPNPRFDYESSLRWMRRFDADGDWPSPEQRQGPSPSSSAANTSEPMRLRCPAGEPCPREGFWFTPARAGRRRHFEAGELMPDVGGDYGATIWLWHEQQ